MEKRILVAFLLSVAILYGSQLLMKPKERAGARNPSDGESRYSGSGHASLRRATSAEAFGKAGGGQRRSRFFE